jgi:hypothetical protein
LPAGRFSIIWIIICSSWWIITSLSAVMFIGFPLQLFMMDNNVRDCIFFCLVFCLYYPVVYTACIRTRWCQSDAACTNYWRRLCWGSFADFFLSPDISTTSSLQFQISMLADL